MRKTVFFQSVAFPFRKGMYDLGVAAFDSLDIKAYRALYTVKIVIKAEMCIRDRVPDIRGTFPDFGTCSFGKGGNFESY